MTEKKQQPTSENINKALEFVAIMNGETKASSNEAHTEYRVNTKYSDIVKK